MNPSTDIAEVVPAPEKAGGGVGVKKGGVAEHTEQDEKKVRDPIKFLGFSLPQLISGPIQRFQSFWAGLRQSTIIALPSFIVNNSSNAIGATQMVGEVLYAKSSGVTLIPDRSKNIFHQILVQPPKSILSSVFGRAKFEGRLSDWLNPSNFKNELMKFVDLKEATKVDGVYREVKDAITGQIAGKNTVKLINRWSSRSGFTGMTSMAVAMMFPDEKESEETILQNGRLLQSNPLLYLGKRFAQAVWFPAEALIRSVKKLIDPQTNQHIGEHKRQFAGLGMTLTGIFSVISGLRQVEGKFDLGQNQHYMRNPWQMLGGLITTIAGQALMNSVDNEKGWSNYGNIQFLRIAPLIPSITTRFRPGPNGLPEQGADWYLAAQSVFQGKNVVASLIGGANKRKNSDGTYTVVDFKAIREQAKIEGIEAKQKHKKHHDINHGANFDEASDKLIPDTTISHVSAERAMPERVGAVDRAKEAAVV